MGIEDESDQRPSPVVLQSAAGHGVHHLYDWRRNHTYCGYRVRYDDQCVAAGLPACAACYEAAEVSS